MYKYRVFFKKYGDTAKEKSVASIELEGKSIDRVTTKVIAMGKRKKYRVCMVAEIAKYSGLSDKL